MRNSLSRHSLAWFPNLIVTGLTYGICIVAVPLIASGYTGWTEDQLGSLNGTAQLVAGIATIAIGGFVVGKIGAQRSLWLLRLLFVALLGWMIWFADSWSDPRVLMTFVFGWIVLHFVSGISDVVINMRLSPPAISATQFSIFMAVSNMGISLAGILIGSIASLAEPRAMLLLLMLLQGLSVAMLLIVHFPTEQIGRLARAVPGAKDEGRLVVPPGAAPARD